MLLAASGMFRPTPCLLGLLWSTHSQVAHALCLTSVCPPQPAGALTLPSPARHDQQQPGPQRDRDEHNAHDQPRAGQQDSQVSHVDMSAATATCLHC